MTAPTRRQNAHICLGRIVITTQVTYAVFEYLVIRAATVSDTGLAICTCFEICSTCFTAPILQQLLEFITLILAALLAIVLRSLVRGAIRADLCRHLVQYAG